MVAKIRFGAFKIVTPRFRKNKEPVSELLVSRKSIDVLIDNGAKLDKKYSDSFINLFNVKKT